MISTSPPGDPGTSESSSERSAAMRGAPGEHGDDAAVAELQVQRLDVGGVGAADVDEAVRQRLLEGLGAADPTSMANAKSWSMTPGLTFCLVTMLPVPVCSMLLYVHG